ncbi:MAG: hypothetical protein AB1512_02125 [Thermodesulfobacteriota bacterium]
MAKKKYAKYVGKMAIPAGLPEIPPHRRVLYCDASVLPIAPWHIETIHWTSTGSAYAPGRQSPMANLPAEYKKRPVIHQAFGLEPEGMYPMYHTYDEVFIFCGTDQDDPTDLGGEIEFWLGAGEHAEKQVINKSSYVYVPAGMVHCPMDCTKLVRPFVEIVITPSPLHTEFHIDLWPKGYKAMPDK